MFGKIYFNYMIMGVTGVNKTQQFELERITKYKLYYEGPISNSNWPRIIIGSIILSSYKSN